MAEDSEEEYERLAHTQRLKAAVHYTTGRICEEVGEEKEVMLNKQFIAVLSEATYKYSQRMAVDLELFAKHAKRSTVNADDVKLLVRKSPQLLEYIQGLSQEMAAANEEKRSKRAAAGKKGGKKKSTAAAAANSTNMDTLDEDSNL